MIYKSKHAGEVSLLMDPDEPDHIMSFLKDDSMIVEWGCGGSTLYFLDHLKPSQKLFTIEHNKEWYDRVNSLICDHPNINNHNFYYIAPIGATMYYGVPEEETPVGLKNYMEFDLNIIPKADVFFIDGIGRGAVAAWLSKKIKNDAIVFIHDYKERESWYDWATSLYDIQKTYSRMSLIELTNINTL